MSLILNRKKSNRGRPCSVDWDKFFDCMFSICDNGTKLSDCKDHYGIARSTIISTLIEYPSQECWKNSILKSPLVI